MRDLAEYLYEKLQSSLKREQQLNTKLADIKFCAEAAIEWLKGEHPHIHNAMVNLHSIVDKL